MLSRLLNHPCLCCFRVPLCGVFLAPLVAVAATSGPAAAPPTPVMAQPASVVTVVPAAVVTAVAAQSVDQIAPRALPPFVDAAVPLTSPLPSLTPGLLTELVCSAPRSQAPSHVFVFHDGESAFIPPSLIRGSDLVDATMREALRLCNVPEGQVDTARLTMEWKLFLPVTVKGVNHRFMPCHAAKEELKVGAGVCEFVCGGGGGGGSRENLPQLPTREPYVSAHRPPGTLCVCRR